MGFARKPLQILKGALLKTVEVACLLRCHWARHAIGKDHEKRAGLLIELSLRHDRSPPHGYTVCSRLTVVSTRNRWKL